MIIPKNSYYEEDERLFSTGDPDLDDILEEVYYSGIEDGYEYAQKEFGGKSKALAIFAPGAWQAKEAAKYGYDDEDDYKEDRAGYALKGWLTPGTAMSVKHKARKMAEEGKSPEEIRRFLEGEGEYRKAGKNRRLIGTAEALTGGFGGVTHTAAHWEGLYDALANDDKRKKFKKNKKKDD